MFSRRYLSTVSSASGNIVVLCSHCHLVSPTCYRACHSCRLLRQAGCWCWAPRCRRGSALSCSCGGEQAARGTLGLHSSCSMSLTPSSQTMACRVSPLHGLVICGVHASACWFRWLPHMSCAEHAAYVLSSHSTHPLMYVIGCDWHCIVWRCRTELGRGSASVRMAT
jgi:hypothetical protein